MPKRPNYGMSYTKEASLRTMGRILLELSERPMTTHELAVAVHVCKSHARRYLLHMQKEKQVYIQKWVRDEIQGMRNYLREVWAAGDGKNAPKPRPMSDAEVQARYRAKLKEADPIGYLHRRKIDYVKSKAPKRDIAASWI